MFEWIRWTLLRNSRHLTQRWRIGLKGFTISISKNVLVSVGPVVVEIVPHVAPHLGGIVGT